MAKNKPYGDNARKGFVNERTQVKNKRAKRFVKRDSGTGKFMDMKYDKKSFRGVMEEK